MRFARLIFAAILVIAPYVVAGAADDAYGDPLPAEAKLRLGTDRLRANYAMGLNVLTPDGKYLVGRDEQGGLRYVDPASGKTVKTVPVSGAFGTIAAMSADGKRAVIVSYDSVFVVDAEKGTVLGSIKQRILGAEHRVSPSADGKLLALSPDKQQDKDKTTAIVWDVDANKVMATVNPIQNPSVKVALSPDGKFLATWGRHYEPNAKGPPDEATDPSRIIQFWEAKTGKELGKGRIAGDANDGSMVAFSPDGAQAAASGGNGQISLLDPATGAAKRLLLGRSGMGQQLAFSPDGKTLAAGGAGGAIQRWSLPDGKLLDITVPTVAPSYGMRTIQYADAARVVAWGARGSVHLIWEAPSNKVLSLTSGHTGPVTAIAVAAGGKEYATTSTDGTIIRWDAETGKEKTTVKLKPGATGYGAGYFEPIQLTRDGALAVVTGTDTSSQGVYDASSGQHLFILPLESNRQSRASLAPDGRRIIQTLTSYDAKKYPARVVVWDLASTTKLGGVELPGVNDVTAATSPDGAILFTAGNRTTEKGGNELAMAGWELATGKKLGEFTEEGGFGAAHVLPTSEPRVAIVATRKGRLIKLDASTGKSVGEFDLGANKTMAALTLSPDMKTLAVASGLGFGANAAAKIHLFDVASGKEKKTISAQASSPSVIAFSPDGKQLFVGAQDTTVLIFEVGAE